jgi:ATP-binding protein involved in chromosome partitioning
MPGPSTTPTEVGPTEDGSALRIRWQDGSESVLEPWLLRIRCPCARCVDEMTGRRILRPEDVSEDVHPTAIHYVGRYALQFVWSDGHSTGIYPFDYLRALGEEGLEVG